MNRLGLLATKQTVDALSNRSLYEGASQKYAAVVEVLWEHSLSCAHACQIICALKGLKLAEDPVTLGRLHDIGKLLRLRVIGELEKGGKGESTGDADELLATMDAHHGKSGAVLLKKWLFAGVFVQVAELHDHVEHILTPSRELMVVHRATPSSSPWGTAPPTPAASSPNRCTPPRPSGSTPRSSPSSRSR